MDVKEIEKYLTEDHEGGKLLQKLTDKRVTQAIESYKTNHLQAEVDKAAQKETEGLEAREADLTKRLAVIELKENLIQKAVEKNIPVGLALRQLGSDERETQNNFNDLMNLIESREISAVNKIMQKNNSLPKGGDSSDDGFTLDDAVRMARKDYPRNRDKITKILKNQGAKDRGWF